MPELEAAIAEVGGDDAVSQIWGREAFLRAREYVEKWNDSRDWIDLKTEQKVDLNAYAAQKIAGTPKEAAAILRHYAADAKLQAPQSEGETFGLAVGKDRKAKTSFIGRWFRAASNNDGDDLPEYNPQEWQDEERYLAETKAEIAAFRKTSAAQDFKGVADFLRKNIISTFPGLTRRRKLRQFTQTGFLTLWNVSATLERFDKLSSSIICRTGKLRDLPPIRQKWRFCDFRAKNLRQLLKKNLEKGTGPPAICAALHGTKWDTLFRRIFKTTRSPVLFALDFCGFAIGYTPKPLICRLNVGKAPTRFATAKNFSPNLSPRISSTLCRKDAKSKRALLLKNF
ncbi:MAG: hypothetical protein J6K25_14215 [Thermoguttaceae bacterium]|nr:hypothetical protein [Thermoguttaceae bacterium]